MSRISKNRILNLNTEAQLLIRSEFPATLLTEKYNELCQKCQFRFDYQGVKCKLLPITTKGQNCPYFKNDVVK